MFLVTASPFFLRRAQAYLVTLEQVRSNVVATESGAFDLTGLPDPSTALAQSLINPFIGNIVTGSSNAPKKRAKRLLKESLGSH
jgi:hypothetical protein